MSEVRAPVRYFLYFFVAFGDIINYSYGYDHRLQWGESLTGKKMHGNPEAGRGEKIALNQSRCKGVWKQFPPSQESKIRKFCKPYDTRTSSGQQGYGSRFDAQKLRGEYVDYHARTADSAVH